MKFSENSGIGKALSAFVNCIWLGLLWLGCSLPVLTLGASTTALYYAVVKGVRRERGTPTGLFFHAFRENLKTATLSWLVCAAFLAVVVTDLVLLRGAEMQSSWLYTCSWLLLIPPALELAWIFAYISRFQNGVMAGIRFVLFFALQHFGRTLGILALFAAAALLTFFWTPAALVLPGLVCYACSLLIEPAFQPITESLGEADAWYNE